MKRGTTFLFYMFFVYLALFGQVSEQTKQDIIKLYTAYAEATSIDGRLQYIRNPENNRSVFTEYYSGRTLGYTPKRFGECFERDGVYILTEYVEATQLGRSIEIPQRRYFVKTGNQYKLDWESSVGYNSVSWAKFKALKSSAPTIMRCLASLGESNYDAYWGIDIRDSAANRQFTAYLDKKAEYADSLFDLLSDGKAYYVILEMKYIDSNYSKEVVITRYVQRDWCIK